MEPEVEQRIVDCLEGCRSFGNPAALPAVIDALAALLERIEHRPFVLPRSPEVVQLRAALDCLEIHPPTDTEAN